MSPDCWVVARPASLTSLLEGQESDRRTGKAFFDSSSFSLFSSSDLLVDVFGSTRFSTLSDFVFGFWYSIGRGLAEGTEVAEVRAFSLLILFW